MREEVHRNADKWPRLTEHQMKKEATDRQQKNVEHGLEVVAISVLLDAPRHHDNVAPGVNPISRAL